MGRHYFSLWLLLLAAFAVFAVTSAIGMPEIAGYRLKSSGIADAVFGENRPVAPLQTADSSVVDSAVAAERQPVPVDSAAQTILLIGDSMLDGIAPRLGAYASHNGHALYSVIWYSSSTEVWGASDRLRGYICRLKPTFIIVCLGANELFVRDIGEKRGKYVRKILDDIGDTPFLWIGPPNWKEDTGINSLIDGLTPEGTFFLSKGMDFERGRDGAHPTPESAAAWVDSIARWMPRYGAHPILLDVPATRSERPTRTFVHQPHDK